MSTYNALKLLLPAHMQAMGNCAVYDDAVTLATALVINDIIGLIKIPAGVRLTELRFVNDDIDTGTTLQVKIGYKPADPTSSLAAVDNYFGATLTFLQSASGAMVANTPQFKPITFNEEVLIFATVTAAPTGGGVGTITTIAMGDMIGIK